MTNRRTILGLLACVPFAGTPLARLAAQEAVARFAPPSRPFRLIRRVERQLRDGARLVVERSWSVTFAVQGRGYLVDGLQSGVMVDAPPALGFLAQMERDRSEDDMFPLLLDGAGQIVSDSSSSADEALTLAVEQVRQRLESALADSESSDLAGRFLAELQQAGEESLVGWPRNVFAPGPIDRVEERVVPLPGGRNGSIAIHTLASGNPETGLMEHFERRVTSRLGDTVREGLERFSLAQKI